MRECEHGECAREILGLDNLADFLAGGVPLESLFAEYANKAELFVDTWIAKLDAEKTQ